MAKKLQKFLKSFTLIELIIVIAIISVLGVAAFLVLSQWMSKSRDSRKIADLGIIDTAINISITSNDKLPAPDNKTDVLFSGNIVWEVGYFGDEAVKQIGGSLTKTPIDPTTKERYRYGVWNNKYQLGTIIENEQFSKYSNRVYANVYFTRLQGNYNQTIIVAKIDNVDTILPVPSLIVDEYEGEEKRLDVEYFWTNKGRYNLGGDQPTKLKVSSLYSGDLSKLSDTGSFEFNQFIVNFEKAYTGTNFVSVLNKNSQDELKQAIAQELSIASSQPVSVVFFSCEGYTHGSKVDFYKQDSVGFGDSCDNVKAQFECSNGKWIGANKNEYFKTSCSVQSPVKCNGVEHGIVKDFFEKSSVPFGEDCDNYKKNLTCYNGIWKDGLNNADTNLYKYSSCIVGNPVDCNAMNFVKKSSSNIDIIFDISSTLHGSSFEQSKTVNENNGSYDYILVGDCNNGEFQDLELSNPIYKSCNSGYTLNNGSCIYDATWSGNSIDGYTYLESGIVKYPLSCKDLLVSTVPNFKYGINSLYNGTEFLSGNYYIKPSSSTLPIKVYCDMSEQGGGRTVFQSFGSWTYVDHDATCPTIELFSSAVINNMKLVPFTEFDIKTNVQFRTQADDSVNNSRIRTIRFSNFTSYDILMGDGHNNTVLTLTDNKIYCTASDSNNKCGVSNKPSRNNFVTNIFINRLQFNPRCNSSTATSNTRSRNKFTWSGTYYNVYFR